MMLTFCFLQLLTFASAFYLPPFYTPCDQRCLTTHETSDLVNKFSSVLNHNPPNKTLAAKIIDQNFHSISDSVNFIKQIPLNTTATHSLAELLEQEAALPFPVQERTLFLSHTCDTITWYFEFETKPYPTRGIAILFVDLGSRKIVKAYRETNAGATLAAIGYPECKEGFRVGVGSEGVRYEERSCEGEGRGECGGWK